MYDAVGRRTSVKNSGSAFAEAAFNKFGYDDRNQVISSDRYKGTDITDLGVPIDPEKRLYEYDPIGNRITAQDWDETAGAAQTTGYTTNNTNQYQSLTAAGQDKDLTYDDDGNLVMFDDKVYTWNAENRLIAVQPQAPVNDDKKITFLYDYQGRRVRKQVFGFNGTDWNAEPDTEKLFVYDGWNLVKEISTAGGVSSDKYYVWGLDLSQSLQGAGGIGGLICSLENADVYYFFYDANGNVGQLVDAGDGSVAAHYEFEPFGSLTNSYGAEAEGNAFRFSTKYFDGETGLIYYGFRYYMPELGRWLNRDPLDEEGGVNLYLFIKNNVVNSIDLLGLKNLLERLQEALESNSSYREGINKTYYEMFKEKNRSIISLRDHMDTIKKRDIDYFQDYINHADKWIPIYKDRIDALDANIKTIQLSIKQIKNGCSWYCREGTGYIGAGLALFGAHANITILGLGPGVVAFSGAVVNGVATITFCEGSKKGPGLSFLAGAGSLYFDYKEKDYKKDAELAKKLGKLSKHSKLIKGANIFFKLSKGASYADIIINLGPVIKPVWFELLK